MKKESIDVPKNLNISSFFYEFCDNCPNIDVNAERSILYADASIHSTLINISCRNLEVCKHIYEWSRMKEMKNGGAE